MSTEGQVITCRAAVAWAAKEPLTIEEIQVGAPKTGEVRVKIVATGVVSCSRLLRILFDNDHDIELYTFFIVSH